MLLLVGSFLVLMLVGVPVAISMAAASSSICFLQCRARHHRGAADDCGRRKLSAACGALFILGRQPHELRRRHRPHLFLRVALVGWMKGGWHQVNIVGSVIFSGMSGTAACGRRGHRDDRDQGDEGSRLSGRSGGRRYRRFGDAWSIFPPSLPFVIYGMMANVSIGALFMAVSCRAW